MVNTLVVIGWTGIKRAYLNVPREEAVRRCAESEECTPADIAENGPNFVQEFSFHDEFGTYDAWGDE